MVWAGLKPKSPFPLKISKFNTIKLMVREKNFEFIIICSSKNHFICVVITDIQRAEAVLQQCVVVVPTGKLRSLRMPEYSDLDFSVSHNKSGTLCKSHTCVSKLPKVT